MPRRTVLFAVVLAALLATTPASARDASPPAPPEAQLTPAITADEWLTHAAHLASDDMVGRESGTPGGRAAEEYVAAALLGAGLEPFGAEGTPFVDVALPMRPMKPEETTLAIGTAEGSLAPVGAPTDVLPFSFSENATVTAPVVFCGYGLVDEDNGWNDYEGVDVQGKIALVLRHGPREDDPESPWAMTRRTPPRQRMKLAFTTKAANAVAAGAGALIMVNDRHHGDEMLPVRLPGKRQSIPIVAVSRAVGDQLVAPLGKTLGELQIELDERRTPVSRPVGARSVTLTAKLGETLGRNVLAIRRGADPQLARECVVIGAHLDHVGTGRFGSGGGAEARGQIHNGADDNASGTAALLEIAAYIASRPLTRRTILFAGWCGEEMGLVGSRAYVAEPRWPLKQTIACVNIDMLGRYRASATSDEGLRLVGADTGSTFRGLAEKAATDAGLRFSHSREGWQQSDHYAFYEAGRPALFFTTGLHPEYHRPNDDWWLLASDGAAASARAIADVVLELANAPEAPEFAKLPPRPVLGVRLRADDEKPGAILGFVSPDMAAARAGLRIGDRIVRWGKTDVESVARLYALLGMHKPGDVVPIRFYRGETLLDAKVTLTSR